MLTNHINLTHDQQLVLDHPVHLKTVHVRLAHSRQGAVRRSPLSALATGEAARGAPKGGVLTDGGKKAPLDVQSVNGGPQRAMQAMLSWPLGFSPAASARRPWAGLSSLPEEGPRFKYHLCNYIWE